VCHELWPQLLHVGNIILPILTAHSADLAHLNLPLLQSEQGHLPHRQRYQNSKFFINEGGLKKLQNYYFSPRPTHRLSQPNRPITSMQIMQPATQVHVPFQNPTQHTPSKVYRSLVPPCVLQPKLQKKKRKKKDKLPPRRKIETNKLTPQTPLFACREA
jgi:hypothetical protein